MILIWREIINTSLLHNISNLTDFKTQDPKTKKNDWPEIKKIITLSCGLIKKKKKISEVSKSLIWHCKQNRKLGNLGKFSFVLHFFCFDCIKCRKAENFYWILKEWISHLPIQKNKDTIQNEDTFYATTICQK